MARMKLTPLMAPRPSYAPPPEPAPRTDRRYGTQRWKRMRAAVLQRDNYVCQIVPGCLTPADVADHFSPVTPDMPDAMFFGLHNLRAACNRHNVARGFAERLDREMQSRTRRAVVTGDYTYRPPEKETQS